mmetsp:Transcript_5840/g.15922  ORF Transcript_5840/g.15922 Transcript_5840/m.15922 type:complete len:200 (+) Transcript_5840:564-1163(+)
MNRRAGAPGGSAGCCCACCAWSCCRITWCDGSRGGAPPPGGPGGTPPGRDPGGPDFAVAGPTSALAIRALSTLTGSLGGVGGAATAAWAARAAASRACTSSASAGRGLGADAASTLRRPAPSTMPCRRSTAWASCATSAYETMATSVVAEVGSGSREKERSSPKCARSRRICSLPRRGTPEMRRSWGSGACMPTGKDGG